MCKHNECCNYCQREFCKSDFRIKVKESESKIKITVESESMSNTEMKEKIRGIINDIFNFPND
jgi:hypothetical protein